MSDDAVDWLYGLQSHGIKLGLTGIRSLLALLDDPHASFASILVAGTNGKGSVAAMLEATLRAHGLRVGMTTSPHLVRPEERIRIDGADIDEDALARVLDVVRDACRRGLDGGSLAAHPSFFEVVTAAACLAFRDAGVEVGVLEVGLGGRLDATNAVEPIVSSIVTVDLDHVATLGDTLAAIAREKAGIARAGRPLVSGVRQSEARAAIRAHAEAIGAVLVEAPAAPPDALEIPLAGDHQRHNAAVALATLDAAAGPLGRAVDSVRVREGLAATRWPGRLQTIEGAPPLLLDGAHNAAGAHALASHLAGLRGPVPVLVFAAMQDKDVEGMIAPLLPHVGPVVATAPAVARSLAPEELARRIRLAGGSAEAAPTPEAALARARELAGARGLVVVAGSLYLVGSILALASGRRARGPVAM